MKLNKIHNKQYLSDPINDVKSYTLSNQNMTIHSSINIQYIIDQHYQLWLIGTLQCLPIPLMIYLPLPHPLLFPVQASQGQEVKGNLPNMDTDKIQ